jgi:hypothetical protein
MLLRRGRWKNVSSSIVDGAIHGSSKPQVYDSLQYCITQSYRSSLAL